MMVSQANGVAGLFRGQGRAARGERRRPSGRRREGRAPRPARPGGGWATDAVRASRPEWGRRCPGGGARRDPSGPREEEGAFGMSWRGGAREEGDPAALPGAREEERRPIRFRPFRPGMGAAMPGRRRGIAADHKPWEEEGARDGFTRRGQGGGEAPPRVPGARGGGRAPDGVGPFWPGMGRQCQGGGLAPPRYQTPGRRRGVRSGWTFAVRMGAAVPREEGGASPQVAGVQGGGGTPGETYLP